MNARRGITALTALTAVCAWLLAGCTAHFDPVDVHVHSAHCGHYWDGHGWGHAYGHVHGGGCGHVWSGGRWVVAFGAPEIHVAPPPVEIVAPAVHVHSTDCGHYWDGGSWVLLQGHVHGPSCGHVFMGGQWTVHVEAPSIEIGMPSLSVELPLVYVDIPATHVHSATCGHCYEPSVGRWVVFEGHIHSPSCGHLYEGGVWVVHRDRGGRRGKHR